MKKELAEVIVECLHIEGYDEAEVRENYSSRGTHGKETCGVVSEAGVQGILGCVLAHADLFVDEDGYPIFDDEDVLLRDEMGLGYIIY